MKYERVHLEAISYELAPVVVSSEELEDRLAPLYQKLHIAPGSLEALTGIVERRWWEPNDTLSRGATAAARKALARSHVPADALEMVLYTGVCREKFEPATACRVASALGVHPRAAVYDISNACLGVLNGIHEVANRIELGQIRAGLVTSAETAREIVEITMERMLADASMSTFTEGLATLTGGSGAVAVLLTDGSFGTPATHRVIGGAQRTAPQHYALCEWGLQGAETLHRPQALPQAMHTDPVAVLQHGVALGKATWDDFLAEMGWTAADVDKVVMHQVGAPHRDTILKEIGISLDKDFSTFPYLGNIGTVSLPITAALAEEREAISSGDTVAFLGIGSGLNCLMLGVEW
jgi:3-oxoacyl-[acyl-carrier-protein] synthase III